MATAPRLDAFPYRLPAASRERSITQLGSVASLAPLVAKLRRGSPITVGVLGASVSLNGGCNQQPSRRCQEFDGVAMKLCHWGEPRTRPFKGFYVRMMEVINATWPHPQHRLNNSAADTTPPQAYLDYCFFSHLPRKLDLVILEFGSMGASASFPGVEAIMRVLLSMQPRPHLAFFTVREWCKASVRPWGSAPPYGPSDVTRHTRAEAAFTRLCTHYNQSCISYHEALSPHFYAKEARFSMLDIAADCLHPNRGRLGNDYVTELLVHWLTAALRRVAASSDARAGLDAQPALPPPLFDSGRVLAAQGQTRNERCYGFSGLGGGRQRYQRLASVPWHTAYCPRGDAIDAPLRGSACTHVDAVPAECPTVIEQRTGSLATLPPVWLVATSKSVACRLAAVVPRSNAKAQLRKRSPGAMALVPGATLDLPVDTELAVFSASTASLGASASASAGASASAAAATPPSSRMQMQMQYLTAPSGMGIVSVRCVVHTGCACAVQRIDAHQPNASLAGTIATHTFEVRGGAVACVLRVRILDATSSGSYGFKVRQLTITDAHNQDAALQQQTATPSSVAVGSGSRRAKRVARKQRKMVKGSYK